jgi:hypothetical protein
VAALPGNPRMSGLGAARVDADFFLALVDG